MVAKWGASRLLALVMAVGVLVPAVAWAGKRVTSGQQNLQIKASLRPSRAGARGVRFEFRYVYTNAKNPGQQPPYNTKSITFTEPKGVVLKASAVPGCRESAVIKANGNAGVCPSAAKVGSGSVVVNARPAIKGLINGTVTVYNGVDDGGYGGSPKGSRELILYVKTAIGANTVDYFHLVRASDGQWQLVAGFVKPAKPGVAPGFTVQRLDLTLASSSRKPYLSNPSTCSGSWPFSITVRNWFGQPSITARDQVNCTSS